MKKKIGSIILLCILIIITGCDNEKTYKEKGLQITMDKGFYYKTHSQADIYLVKNEIAFTAFKDKYTNLQEYDLNELSTINDYMDLLFTKLGTKYQIYNYDNLKYFTYSVNEGNEIYSYLVSVYKTNGAFWVCSFSTNKNNFPEFINTFLKWSKTIKVY